MKAIIPVLLLLSHLSLAQERQYSINKEGYLVLEAENMPHSELWNFVAVEKGKNCTGTGYLKYVGPVTGSGHDQETDTEGKLQGNPEDWLVIPVEVKVPGRYRINLRNHHLEKDGDNDIWVHIVGWPPPIKRVGDHAVDSFQWLTWGPDWVYWDIEKPGLYEFYVAGRSHGFGIDRIAIYNEKAPISVFLRETKPANE
ncbi:hypothetical protein WJR50_26735 [Catalinimonas sp. 4WD22]|uniref:hypothetical protein n=1 Tax=Catalinimonas locisalis TaxID=3133978 RepID=UPI003100EB45